MSTNRNKVQWHYETFNSCAEFESWQAECNYGRNIKTIIPVPSCPTEEYDGPSGKIFVTWWVAPPGNSGGHGCGDNISTGCQ